MKRPLASDIASVKPPNTKPGRSQIAFLCHETFDPWSFSHSGGRWVDEQWLSDLSLYLWSALFGTRALVYWMWTVLLATFLLLMGLLHRLTGHVTAAFLAALLAIATASPFFELRPHLYTLLLTVLLLWALLGRIRLRSFLLPLLFVLWSNIHGGFAFGLVVLAVVLAFGGQADSAGESPVRRSWREHQLWMWTACALACLINPYGWRVWLQPLSFLLKRDSSAAVPAASSFLVGEDHPRREARHDDLVLGVLHLPAVEDGAADRPVVG
jgi:hypothetical protein